MSENDPVIQLDRSLYKKIKTMDRLKMEEILQSVFNYNVYGNEDGTVTKTPLNYYHVTSSEELSYRQEIELGGELYEQFGMRPRGGFMESNTLNATGHNALEQPGDTNLDCEVDILDVIAANKHILGVGTLDKTGLKNADMDGSGIVDSADSLEILKTILS